MREPKLEIDQVKFYKWGFFIFMFIATMNTLGVLQNIYLMKYDYVTQILSAFGSLALNYLFAGFFYYLWNGTKPSITDEDFQQQFIQEMKGGKHDTTKTKRKGKKKRGN